MIETATPSPTSGLAAGRWPDSIGNNPDTPLFQMHT